MIRMKIEEAESRKTRVLEYNQIKLTPLAQRVSKKKKGKNYQYQESL